MDTTTYPFYGGLVLGIMLGLVAPYCVRFIRALIDECIERHTCQCVACKNTCKCEPCRAERRAMAWDDYIHDYDECTHNPKGHH